MWKCWAIIDKCRNAIYRVSTRLFLEEFFQIVEVLPIAQAVLDRAVTLRQIRRMSLGDAIIAATAMVYDRTL